MSITIRHADPGDELDVLQLVEELTTDTNLPAAANEQSVRRFLAAPDTTILVATSGRDILGLLSFATQPSLLHGGSRAEIEAWVVTRERRGQGIGKKLLLSALKLIDEAECATVSVAVSAENEHAQSLYFQAGLTEALVRLERPTVC